MDKKEQEIRKLLGNRFHLNMSYDESLVINEWHLFRRYNESKVYFSKDNEEIMNSETNTIYELYEFAKKHHKKDINMELGKSRIVIAFILIIICIINIINFKNKIISGFIIGADMILIFESYYSHHIWEKNWKVDMLELKEDWEKINEKERYISKSSKQDVDRQKLLR